MNPLPAITKLVLSRLRWVFATGDQRDAEILALRHQLIVLQRQIERAQFTETDRTILAMLSSVFTRRHLADVFLIVSPRQSLAGTADSSPNTGPNHQARNVVDRRSSPSSDGWSSGSPGRIRTGATGGSMANPPGSATKSQRQPCGRSWAPRASTLLAIGPGQRGSSSLGPKRRGSSPLTSRVSTRHSCAGSTSCSSSRSTPVACTSLGSRPTRPGHGPPKPPATSS